MHAERKLPSTVQPFAASVHKPLLCCLIEHKMHYLNLIWLPSTVVNGYKKYAKQVIL